METPHVAPRRDVSCASCGAPLAPDAAECVVCGRRAAAPQAVAPSATMAGAVEVGSVASVVEPAPSRAAQGSDVPVIANTAAPDNVAAASTSAAAVEGERICGWCGEANPADATQCFKCGAAFPRPEQDALLNRVSAERMRLALNEIEMHERIRTPWWKKLFGGGNSGATT